METKREGRGAVSLYTMTKLCDGGQNESVFLALTLIYIIIIMPDRMLDQECQSRGNLWRGRTVIIQPCSL